MLAILPLAAFGVLFLICMQRGQEWRPAVVFTALMWGVWIVIITELLNVLHQLNAAAVALTWSGMIAIGIIVYWRSKPIHFQHIRFKVSLDTGLLLAGIGGIALATVVTAVLAPPNTWDSMTYHMSRVMHWIQNGSINYYPTSIARQLYQPPLAEWLIMHLQLLSGGDHLANLVQWLSGLGCLVTTSLIAQELGAKPRGQVLTAVVAATLNMAILQSSSTQNDLVAAFWISCAAYLSLYGIRKRFNWMITAGLAAAIGLSVLTKGTTYVYLALFVVWVLIYAWRKQRRDMVRYGLALAVVSLLLNIGQFVRNMQVFGSPMGGETTYYSNAAMSLPLWASNVVRNLALQAAVQPELDAEIGFSQRVNEAVATIHKVLGLDVNDPRVTLADTHFLAAPLILHEDQTAAPAQLLLALLALGVVVVRIRSLGGTALGGYALAVVGAFALFCLLLRWQPWNNRLHLPWFMLLAPLIGTILDRYFSRYLAFAAAVYLLYLALFPTVFNQSRPLLGRNSILRHNRWDVLFYNRPELQPGYTAALDQIDRLQCNAVGLQLGLDTWEYPLWARNEGEHPLRFTYVESVVDMPPEFEPCAVIASKDRSGAFEANIQVQQWIYTQVWQDDYLAVYQAAQ